MEETKGCNGEWRIKDDVGPLRISTREVGWNEYETSIKHADEPQHEGYERVAGVVSTRKQIEQFHTSIVNAVRIALKKAARS